MLKHAGIQRTATHGGIVERNERTESRGAVYREGNEWGKEGSGGRGDGKFGDCGEQQMPLMYSSRSSNVY